MSPDQEPQPSIAVIGAGMAGLICARHLRDRGFRPTVLEKSRGLGGRLATRRTDDGLAFDHGAQYVTARSREFEAFVRDAIVDGAADHWRPARGEGSATPTEDWIVGAPAMNSMVKPLADGIDVRLACRVTEVMRDGGRWRVETAEGTNLPVDFVVCTAPAPQAQALLAAEPSVAEALAAVSIASCWALMLSFATAVPVPFDVRRSTSDHLAWVARNSAKPHRTGGRETWVVHASPDWSRRYLELEAAEAAQRMIGMLANTLACPLPPIEYASAHRWRHAQTTVPLGRAYHCSDDRTVFVGGDWCLGGRVEFAFQSGRAMAEAIAQSANSLPR